MSVGVALVNKDGKILHWCYGVFKGEEDVVTEGVEDFGDHWGSHSIFSSFCINWPSRKERKALGDKEYNRTFDARSVYLFQPFAPDYCTQEISDYTLQNYQQNVVLHGETGEVLAKGFCRSFENDGNLFGLLFPEIISSREHKVLELCDWTCTEHKVRYVLHLWEGENFLACKPADIVYPFEMDDLFKEHRMVYLNDSAWCGYEIDIQASSECPWQNTNYEKFALRHFHFKKFRGKLRAKIIEPLKEGVVECDK